MATNLAIDTDLLEEARGVGHLRTKRETVNLALKEFVNRRKQRGIIELFGSMDPDPGHDYKESRRR
ncbi:MAG: type II toxin-antitoxin system VapB family antitoxin [Lentisphaerae bacterium]|jgi:Arc/MetJ family transcription regulator|nr:type II toxin-antitoxin system VapB family antitoxin [Lentisphaerota bacterium]MBT4818576.1 type II toxin-antitoxin system VapB family antitoxin [Lentisphaerota bacterium]MBT5609359.1 type II toxin-antitoxin system VapB family antitoxin [Lentisphaerota bacterium]MBT7057241.1 type II toxin-antitoxin system VapB family antitoxin [Lentisphaerota bacterium]MBT7843514.1 type II toxin-antitoxin system VapB family antitoxin [Lentisphaerota bacterium]